MAKKAEKQNGTRRTFVQTGAASLAGLGLAGRQPARAAEALALNGGPKAVNFPAARLKALTEWPRYSQGEKDALVNLIHRNKYYDELPLFEKEWQAFTKAKYVKSHMNGTSALASMYFAIDLPPGSEVMVPSHTFFATVVPMRLFGLVPVFVDVDPRTANFDVEYAAKHLTPRTRALVPMHRMGLPCEMDKIEDFARKHGLILLEDAAHAQGATMQGRWMGTWGVIGMTSFQTTKPLPGVEGGMGMYQTREYFERAAIFGHYEDAPKFGKGSPYSAYRSTGLGLKFRMHPMAAAVLRVQLSGLDALNAGVRRRVRSLNDRLAALPGLAEPRCRPDQTRVYYAHNQFLFDAKKAGFSKAAAIKALRAEGVAIADGSDVQEQHPLKIYSEARWWHHAPKIPEVLPGHVELAKTSMHIPIFYEDVPELTDQYVKAFEKVWAHKEELSRA